jgi:hypothetical protein
MTPTVAQTPAIRLDPHLSAFCAPGGPEVFSAVVNANQIWTPDPFDIETIHTEAREAFAALLNWAVARPGPDRGKSLLLLGEAGSGKTHLMRAFRNAAHEDALAYCGYLQMTTRVENYQRYVLSNLIDALSWPYCSPQPTSGLTRLASGLLDTLNTIPETERQRLRDPELPTVDLARLVHRFADVAVADSRFGNIDLDLLRGMLYLLSSDAPTRFRALKWLRCEELSRFDRELLGDLVSRHQDHMPMRTIVDLGRLMAAVHGAALVFCVDQLEEMIDQDRAGEVRGESFRRVVDALVTITEVIPTAVVVVACLETYFDAAKQLLNKPKLDRLEKDPPSMRLAGKRTTDEIEAIVARRLELLYEQARLTPRTDLPTYPFRPDYLQRLTPMRIRDVLDHCRTHQDACRKAGRWLEPDLGSAVVLPRQPQQAEMGTIEVEQRWADHLAGYQSPTLDEESELAGLLCWAVQHISDEMPEGYHFAAEAEERFVPVEMHSPGNVVDLLLVAICDRNPRGGGLGKQIEELARRAGETPVAIVRSSPFPTSPNAVVSRQIAALVAPRGPGRRVEVEPTDWRTMAAFQEFHRHQNRDSTFNDWQRRERPLSRLPSLRRILDLDRDRPLRPATASEVGPPSDPGSPPPLSEAVSEQTEVSTVVSPVETGPLNLGTTRGELTTPVVVTPKELTQHAAFLGGSGSGKTTAALTLIEQLALRGVPAVLIDRKGDLSRYADPEAWQVTDSDEGRARQRRALRERLEVALYTPGAANGRPLTLPIVPPDLCHLPEAEREQLAKYAAAALAGMMGYRQKGTDPKLAILGKAIELLGSRPAGEVTVRGLHQMIDEQDEGLLLAVGGFESRHYRKLAEDLLALSLQRQNLLGGAGERLAVDALVGRGASATLGKSRLTVINTQFLGGADAVEFWMAQFLIAVGRWVTRSPSADGNLQAVFLFDEADQYLPATRQPATKGPMENLLRRARSAGVGLFLATQSPGDLDYKCRDQIRLWLIGRVKETVAIAKLKPMLDAGRGDPASRLPGQQTGQFYLVRDREVVAIQAQRSLIDTQQLPEARILELARPTTTTGR